MNGTESNRFVSRSDASFYGNFASSNLRQPSALPCSLGRGGNGACPSSYDTFLVEVYFFSAQKYPFCVAGCGSWKRGWKLIWSVTVAGPAHAGQRLLRLRLILLCKSLNMVTFWRASIVDEMWGIGERPWEVAISRHRVIEDHYSYSRCR